MVSAAGAAALSEPASLFAEPVAEVVAGMPRRILGRTGAKLSVVGFPGLALGQVDQDRGTRGLRDAFERGINYYDVAPAYGDSQTKMGIALQGLPRDQYFLACKTKMRDRDGARKELEESLKLLKTDHFDLYQLHHVRSVAEAKQALGPGGAMETLHQAKAEGKVKWFGFSAHTTHGALELMKGFKFDTVMFPINFVEHFVWGFGREVLDLAHEQGAAVLAIKPMSLGGWPEGEKKTRQWWYRSVEQPREVDLAWRYALSRKSVVSGIPPSFLDLLDKAIEAAKTYRPITDAELAELKEMAVKCSSIFKRDAEVAFGHPPHRDPGSSHCPYGDVG